MGVSHYLLEALRCQTVTLMLRTVLAHGILVYSITVRSMLAVPVFGRPHWHISVTFPLAQPHLLYRAASLQLRLMTLVAYSMPIRWSPATTSGHLFACGLHFGTATCCLTFHVDLVCMQSALHASHSAHTRLLSSLTPTPFITSSHSRLPVLGNCHDHAFRTYVTFDSCTSQD